LITLTGHGTYDDETGLLRELAAGSSTAFDSIYKKYYEAVRANIFRIMRDEEATDDIQQEVFISSWEKRGQF
jgi:RNA polymerase sigma-70 factor (ECF subfamily)